MVETVLTSPYSDPFEALLDEPCAGTLHHAGAQRESPGLLRLIVDMLAMPFEIRIHGRQGVPCGRRQPFHVQGVRQVGEDAVWPPVPQAVPRPGKPPPRLGGPPIQPGGCRLPQVLGRVVKVQHPRGMAREVPLKKEIVGYRDPGDRSEWLPPSHERPSIS